MRGTPPELKIKVVMSKVVFKGLPTIICPSPLFSQGNGIHHSFFCSVTSGSIRQTERGRVPLWWVYAFFPLAGIL